MKMLNPQKSFYVNTNFLHKTLSPFMCSLFLLYCQVFLLLKFKNDRAQSHTHIEVVEMHLDSETNVLEKYKETGNCSHFLFNRQKLNCRNRSSPPSLSHTLSAALLIELIHCGRHKTYTWQQY